jgi:hypothetical protein
MKYIVVLEIGNSINVLTTTMGMLEEEEEDNGHI